MVKLPCMFFCRIECCFAESEEGVDDDGNLIEDDGADQNGKRKRFKQEVVKKVGINFSFTVRKDENFLAISIPVFNFEK